MKVSTAFLLFILSQTASITSAIPTPDNGNQQCDNNNSPSTITVTVTAHSVTKTVTINAATNTIVGNNAGKGDPSSPTGTSTATGKNSGNKNPGNNDPQSSLQLDPSVIGPNLAKNGLGSGSEAGQAPSQTSKNNFINSCIGKTITNGQQVAGGSCNPVSMGDIPSKNNMISCKFSSPSNFATIPPNTPFDIVMGITGMQTGTFVNPNTNYFAAPQQLNKQGQIIGHSHFVIQKIQSLHDTTVSNPQVFAFFQGVNAAAVNNKLSVTVQKGLPEGVYRLASINTAGNHQPALVPVAQHGSMDDMIYFTVSANSAASSNSLNNVAAVGAQNATNITSTSSTGSVKNSSAAANGTSPKKANTTAISISSAPKVTPTAITNTTGTANTNNTTKPSLKGGRSVRRSFVEIP